MFSTQITKMDADFDNENASSDTMLNTHPVKVGAVVRRWRLCGQRTYLDCLTLVDFNHVKAEAVDSFSGCYKDRLQCEKITHIN